MEEIQKELCEKTHTIRIRDFIYQYNDPNSEYWKREQIQLEQEQLEKRKKEENMSAYIQSVFNKIENETNGKKIK